MLTTAKLQIRQVQGGSKTLTGQPACSSGSMMAKVSWLVEGRASDIWEDWKAGSKDRHAKGKAKADLAISKKHTHYALTRLVNAKSDVDKKMSNIISLSNEVD